MAEIEPNLSRSSSAELLPMSTLEDIEAYYYATCKGSQSYAEAKGNYQFECCICNEILDDNVKTVLHMHSHLGDDFGSPAVRCEQCYRWYNSELELQRHMEEHNFAPTNYVCRICDSDCFNDFNELASHMQSVHCRREMPYACRLCGFRSSLYTDTVAHFQSAHASSCYAQCAFCLQVSLNFI